MSKHILSNNPHICDGRPYIEGTNVCVYSIVTRYADGDSAESILKDNPGLQQGDIEACLRYACQSTIRPKEEDYAFDPWDDPAYSKVTGRYKKHREDLIPKARTPHLSTQY